MPKFKAGDKVVLLKDMDYAVKGSILTCVDNYSVKIDSNDFYYSSKFANTAWVNRVPQFFKLMEEKEEMQFDMKKEPWFIRVNNKEESKVVQEWLFTLGLKWIRDSHAVKYLDAKIICNVFTDGVLSKNLLKTDFMEEVHSSAQEIKLTFKTVIDSVEYPVVKSEQQKKVEELEATIAQAQTQLAQLKQQINKGE